MVSWWRPRAGGFPLSAPRAARGAWGRGPPPMRPEWPRGSAPREPGRVQPVSPDGWPPVPRIFVFEATRSCERLGFGISRWGWGHCPRHDMTLSFLMSCHLVSTSGGLDTRCRCDLVRPPARSAQKAPCPRLRGRRKERARGERCSRVPVTGGVCGQRPPAFLPTLPVQPWVSVHVPK